MINFKSNKKTKAILLIFLTFTPIIANLNIGILYSNDSTKNQDNADSFSNENVIDFQDKLPETSNIQSFNGTGMQMNISLHQSHIDTSTTQFVDLDSSNSFTEPFPDFSGYESSFVNISIENLSAPNKSIIIEDVDTGNQWLGQAYYTSFEVRGNAYLENVSIKVHTDAVDTLYVDLYSAKYDITSSSITFDSRLTSTSYTFSVNNPTGYWENITNWHQLLNVSNTYNDSFFIRVYCGSFNDGYWHNGNDANGDTSVTWRQSGSAPVSNTDMTLKIGLAPLSNAPKPSEVSLKINGTTVTDDTGDSGYWLSTDPYSGVNGNIEFNLIADWWQVSCDVINVQLNYTKTDVKADTSFQILQSGQDVSWNVTVSGGLNYFDSRTSDYNTINYTIPSIWNEPSIEVYNGTINKTLDIIKRSLGNGYLDVQVFNAGNGTYWYLNATSTNLLSSIDMYVNNLPETLVNYSNIVEFNATFNNIIDNGNLNLSVYSPTSSMDHSSIIPISNPGTEVAVYNWDISVDATEYGEFLVQMYWNNNSAAGFLETYLTIVGDTILNDLGPTPNEIFLNNESFDIAIEFNDTNTNLGISNINTQINYSLNGGLNYRYDNVTYVGDGQYNIKINVSDDQFLSYGFVTILINASDTYYQNKTTSYTFHRQIITDIDPSNTGVLGDVIRGLNTSYSFDYTDTLTNPIIDGNPGLIGSNYSFEWHLQNHLNGTYTMHLNTSYVTVTDIPYNFKFNISSVGNQKQEITLIIKVIIIATRIESVSYDAVIARNSDLNQTADFFFNDTVKDEGILGLVTTDVIVRDNSTGILWNTGDFNWELVNPVNDGNYILNISVNGKNSGGYILKVNISKSPNYDWSVTYITFYLKGNDTKINLMSIATTPGGIVSPTGFGYNYTIFEESDTDVQFNVTDLEYSDNIVPGSGTTYNVTYQNIRTGLNGTLSEDFLFSASTHTGTLTTSIFTAGDYLINISISKTNYEDSWYAFNLTIIEKYETRLTEVFVPTQFNAGEKLTIIFKAEYNNGTDWLPIDNANITMTPFFNEIVSVIQYDNTNSTGEVKFDITTGSNLRTINITLDLRVEYNYLSGTYDILDSEISVIPPEPGLTFDDLLPYIIMIGAVLAVAVGSIAVYRGVIVPKKKEKQRILTEVKTIFDDAINLEHILVLYKGTGTCIFFKSFGSDQIDPELIGGFLSAVSSFGKEMATQAALNEISYGDKMLLLADGYLIRVALVLGKNASLILRRHLKEFIKAFEKTYADVLPNWRGQLNYFRNAGLIVDDLLNTSIILPHQISYDFSSVKDLKNPHSKDVLKVAQSCCDEAEREFFFIATLLKDASETTNKDTAEIFMGIKELRDKKILIPIEISAIEAQPISQQELNLINQKVVALTSLNNEEKQKLVQDLGQLGPIEREAYLSSLNKQHEIVTAPIKTTIEGVDVDNRKSAKRGIKELSKRGKIAKGKKDYIKAVEIFESAAILASNWELSDDYVKIEETIRKTKIEDLKEKKTKLEKDAKDAVKSKKYVEAATKYKYASKMASEIFKLGDTTMTKEVKRLTNKANEYEKLK